MLRFSNSGNPPRQYLAKIFNCICIVVVIILVYDRVEVPSKQVNYVDKQNVGKIFTKYDKWIVVTSINEPTDQVKKLSRLEDFKLIVVGDLKTNSNWSLNDTVYLSAHGQAQTHFALFNFIPFNSYTRKNLGYLFAIKLGAEFIYDTDDDSELILNLTSYFNFKEHDLGLVYDHRVKNRVPNVYAHFGQPLIWPRGYPLSEINANFNNSYVGGPRRRSAVQQGVVNGDPDVDAVFRLTKSKKYKRINLFFDESAPSLQLPLYKISPFNSQNTLFCYEAFWALYLPFTVSFRLTDIWRSYWAQRLMWLTNQTLSFYGPNAYQRRNPHSYLQDFKDERDMYSNTDKLIEFMYSWKCRFKKFHDCIVDLSSEMAANRFWKTKEVDSIKLWLNDLDLIGYVLPEIVNFENDDSFDVSNRPVQDYPIGDFDYTQIRFTPNFQISIDSDNYCCNERIVELYDRSESFNYFKTMCSRYNFSLNSDFVKLNELANETQRFNFSLLITFNFLPLEENIVTIKNLYQDYFQNLVFCGLNITRFLSKERGVSKRFDSFTFIELDTVDGWYHYYCMSKAIELNYNTRGFFLMSDDVLIKFSKLRPFNQANIWFGSKLFLQYEFKEGIVNDRFRWKVTVKSLRKLYTYISNYMFDNQTYFSVAQIDLIKKYFTYTIANSNQSSKAPQATHNGSDWFYLPRSKFEGFHFFANLYRKFEVFLEIAVPTILAGLDWNNSTEIVTGKYYWDGSFQFDPDYLKEENVFYHPVKLSRLVNDTDFGSKLCNLVIKNKFN